MKNIFLLLTFLLSFTGLAQKIKLENFQLVSYDINSSNKVEFNSYSTIDRNGKLNVYIDGYKGKTYYSYQLSENEIKTVNDLDKENLESFVAKKHLDPNHGYAGSRNYTLGAVPRRNWSARMMPPLWFCGLACLC